MSETSVRNWLVAEGIVRGPKAGPLMAIIPEAEIATVRQRTKRQSRTRGKGTTTRVTKDHVSRVISRIGKEAGIVVRKADGRTVQREKFASAHDLRRGCAQRLINCGVSAETLKVVMRHADFATTEKHYGALRSVQAAGDEVQTKLAAQNPSFVGGLVGGKEEAPQLSAEELLKLKSLLNSL